MAEEAELAGLFEQLSINHNNLCNITNKIIAHQIIQILSRIHVTIIFIVLLTRIRFLTAREAHRRRKSLYRFEAVRTLEIYRRQKKQLGIKINLTPVRCGSKHHIQQYK